MSNPILEQPNLSLNHGHSAEHWTQPIPLAYVLNNEAPYPLDALPELIQRIVHAYQSYGQQPISVRA